MSNDRNKPVTIKSIANELGISFSSVSKALNGNPAIKEETRQMVLEKAKEMGYTPNSLAKGLRSNSTKTIAIIFNDIENPSLTYIFRTISIEMAKYGYTTMIFDSQFSEATEHANLLTVLSRKPDFIILEPTTLNSDNLRMLDGFAQKLILLGSRYESVNCHHVSVDYMLGGYLSACELLSKGHKNCIIMTVPTSFPISDQYVKGIQKAYEEYGLPFSESMVKETSASISSGFQIIRSLWDDEKEEFSIPLTGVLTFDDMLAHGVYRAADVLGFKIPEDVSVIGFDDNPLSAFSMPPLTTIHLPKETMAESCIKILHSVLLEKKPETCIFSLEPYLVSRKSADRKSTKGRGEQQ